MKLAKDEKILYDLKPSNKLILIWLITRCIPQGISGSIMLLVGGFVWLIYSGKEKEQLPELAFVLAVGLVLFILILIVSYIYHRFLIKTIAYLITDRRCIWIGGILRKVEHSVSFYKITDVERSQNIAEQVLPLSTINLFTPGTASVKMNARSQSMPELRFEGLVSSEEQAESINEQIRHYGGSAA